MKEKLLYKINGKEYLLIEEVLPSGGAKRLDKKVKKCKAITQGVKKIKPGFLFNGYAILKFLVPVENIELWGSL